MVAVIAISGCSTNYNDDGQNYQNQTPNGTQNQIIIPSDLAIMPITDGICTVGDSCNVQVAEASGGELPYTFTADSYTTGTTPMGVVIGMGGSLSGTPSREGDYAFGICVKDMTGTSKCTQTSVTVNPKTETPADNTNGGTDEKEPSATVDSAACSLVSKDNVGSGTIKYVFRLTGSGTVTGPVGTRVSVGSAPDDSGDWGTYLSEDTASFNTDSWTNTGESTGYSPTQYRYSRGQGDPETTTWHLDGGDFSFSASDFTGPFNGDSVHFTVYVNYYGSAFAGNIYRPVRSGAISCSG